LNTEAGLYGSAGHAASAVGNVPAVRLLLTNGVEVNAVGVIYSTLSKQLQSIAIRRHLLISKRTKKKALKCFLVENIAEILAMRFWISC
jgi:predicted DNA-binding transcriptional regulator